MSLLREMKTYPKSACLTKRALHLHFCASLQSEAGEVERKFDTVGPLLALDIRRWQLGDESLLKQR
jgi:hypothetical protein